MGGVHYFLLNFFLSMECEVQLTFKLCSHMINQRPRNRGDVIESRQSAGAEVMTSGLLFRDPRGRGLEQRMPFHAQDLHAH